MTSLGRVIAQRYRMLYPLGQGGMGSVWVGEHIELNTSVAVKFIDTRLAADEQARKRFRREAQAAAALNGQHVVQVFDYGIDDGDPYIVMELLDGETLATRLAREGSLDVEDTARMVAQVAKGLARAHEQGIVHRDLKPENIFLVSDDDTFSVKLLDFGVAKILGSVSDVLTQPGFVVGTIHYTSPEQLHGSQVDARADIWSLAVVTYECLTGQRPIDAPSTPQLISAICNPPFPAPSSVAAVPPGFDEWFARATHKTLSERHASIRAAAVAFEQLAAGASGKCSRLRPGSEPPTVPNVIAYPSSEEREHQRPSSIPAAINGRRDINHIALIAQIGDRGAVLWTRHRSEVGGSIRLTLHFDNETQGHTTFAEIVAVSDDRADRPDMWPYEVRVRFAQPLDGVDHMLATSTDVE